MSGQNRPTRLGDLIDLLQSTGRYSISLEEITETLGGSVVAIRSAIRRLKERGRLVGLRRGFYVIVPVEYRATGAPPATWFVDELMHHLGRPYYVALLSAAALYGAGHQQPNVFQVMAAVPIPHMTAGRTRLEFYRNRSLNDVPTRRLRTETGTIAVSTPEATLMDLIRHYRVAGHLSNVATVLSELVEEMSPAGLEEAAASAHVAEAQRAGYLLELVGREDLASALESFLSCRRTHRVPLRSDAGVRPDTIANERWNLLVNEVVEPDS